MLSALFGGKFLWSVDVWSIHFIELRKRSDTSWSKLQDVPYILNVFIVLALYFVLGRWPWFFYILIWLSHWQWFDFVFLQNISGARSSASSFSPTLSCSSVWAAVGFSSILAGSCCKISLIIVYNFIDHFPCFQWQTNLQVYRMRFWDSC